MAADDSSFDDTDKRWLLIAGGGLSASSGVPLPFRRTRWSPSLEDIVRHHLFRQHSRQVFESVERADERQPPLGFVGDTLEAQQQWLAGYLQGLEPHRPLIRVADLARAGMFEAIVTDAPDRLLDSALDRAGVRHRQISLDDPAASDGASLPVVREWDDRVFLDTENRRARERRFLHSRMDEWLGAVDAVLVVGHGGHTCDLSDALRNAVGRHPDLEIVWVEQSRDDDDDAAATAWLAANHAAFTHVRVDDLGDYLDGVADRRGVERTQITAPEPPTAPLLRRAMNRSFDVRPVLVYIPGMAVFGKLIDRMPKIPVKAFLSLFALMLSLVAYCNYDIWTEYRDQIKPVKSHMAAARAHLEGEATYESALLAEAELNEAARKSARVVLPYDTLFSIGYLHKLIEEHYESTNIEIKSIRDLEITPRLYRTRFRATVGADPQRMSLSHHPPVQVLAGGPAGEDSDPRDLFIGDRRLDSYRIARSIDDFAADQRLAIHADSAALLRVTTQEAMLDELEAGRLAIDIDLSTRSPGRLEDHIYAQMKTAAGYTGDREALYSPDGIVALLDDGQATFYFSQLEATGVPQNLTKIRELLTRFPTCRAVVSTYTAKARAQLTELAPEFTRVSIAEYTWPVALDYLRERTTPEFVRAIMQDYHLRRSITDPLVLSLLVDYHRFTGAPPRGLALVYDRLLQNSLDRGEYGFAPKLRVLSPLAWEMYATGDNLTRETATRLISALLFRDTNLDAARAVLDEMVANGVLRFRSDTYVAFMDEAFLHLCVAKHLATLDVGQRVAFLLANDERIAAFHAGLFPAVDELVDTLVAPYDDVDAVLRRADKHLAYVNPYIRRLRRVAFVVQNGEPSHDRVTSLETRLFELMDHADEQVRGEAKTALSSFSTEAIRSWVLLGLDTGVAYDHRLTHFTASASEQVYVAPIERWLDRLATEADPRRQQRYEWHAIQDITGAVVESKRGAATLDTQRAIYEALTTLAQVGTAHALAQVRAYARRASDSRFSDEVWLGVRRKAAKLLLAHGAPDDILMFRIELEAAPAAWSSVIMDLATTNDDRVAQALARVIAAPQEFDRNELEHKRVAAAALAVMDREVAMPPLMAALEAEPSTDASDYLPYVALSLGYRGDPRDTPAVIALTERVAADRLAGYERDRRAEHYIGTLGRALAVFASEQAFEQFAELYANPAWRELDATMFGYVANFPIAAAVELNERELLCVEHNERVELAMLRNLGWFGIPEARDVLEELLRVVDGSGDVDAVAARCGDSRAIAAEKLARWKMDWLSSFVGALGIEARDADVPRFARWAMHGDRSVRRKAIDVLRTYHLAGAGRAVAASLAAYPDQYQDALYALGEQRVAANEQLVAPYLDDPKTHWTATLAMRWVGGVNTLLRVYPEQATITHPSSTRQAVFYIGERTLGDGVPHDAIMAATRQLAAAR